MSWCIRVASYSLHPSRAFLSAVCFVFMLGSLWARLWLSPSGWPNIVIGYRLLSASWERVFTIGSRELGRLSAVYIISWYWRDTCLRFNVWRKYGCKDCPVGLCNLVCSKYRCPSADPQQSSMLAGFLTTLFAPTNENFQFRNASKELTVIDVPGFSIVFQSIILNLMFNPWPFSCFDSVLRYWPKPECVGEE